ncbi:MerR family transcriptional regulator [Gordonia otitidis]|uniref:MerR family transcriptional regulator n=1 Tax=Gordonia otitidis (strain DSM 44809 / CCUG 52243 / JCM 12355 / NBRC 100426 / IFM 10032) TaxID=1108044 RepID=H5TIM8_GORO1|nr:MerR family transcriptional regulator [Gordonia otitidis]GAB33336.1 putative MerR family transcriptional regulator [Gordonia otitidis NBRC 100426]
MRIGELSKRSGVSIRSLRYYEEQRLLHPARLPSGYRVYEDADVSRVQRIQALLGAGLSTRKIEHILPCLAQHEDGVALACSDLYAELVAERDELLGRIDTLRTSVEALETVISASPRPLTV